MPCTMELLYPEFEYPCADECHLLCFEQLRNRCASEDELMTDFFDWNDIFSIAYIRSEDVFSIHLLSGFCIGVVAIVEGQGYVFTWVDESGSVLVRHPENEFKRRLYDFLTDEIEETKDDEEDDLLFKIQSIGDLQAQTLYT